MHIKRLIDNELLIWKDAKKHNHYYCEVQDK